MKNVLKTVFLAVVVFATVSAKAQVFTTVEASANYIIAAAKEGKDAAKMLSENSTLAEATDFRALITSTQAISEEQSDEILFYGFSVGSDELASVGSQIEASEDAVQNSAQAYLDAIAAGDTAAAKAALEDVRNAIDLQLSLADEAKKIASKLK